MPKGAIDYDTEDELVTEEVGAIVVATGYQLYDVGKASRRASRATASTATASTRT